ncbi:MAG: methyltransferase domain-containing protein [Phormidesmis sp.]
MEIHKILKVIIKSFRTKRMTKFLKIIDPQPDEKILDIGGTVFNWKLINCKNEITLLNLTVPKVVDKVPSNVSFVIGDGTHLKYSDKEYDICFSNSVIEHVGSFENQRMFAQEICRVGKRIWLQTPAKSFFFEPHYITPFLHWLPKPCQKKLLRNFSIWGLITRPTQQYIDDFVEQTRLLTYKELKGIFPSSTIMKERFLFMTKSYLIIGNAV